MYVCILCEHMCLLREHMCIHVCVLCKFMYEHMCVFCVSICVRVPVYEHTPCTWWPEGDINGLLYYSLPCSLNLDLGWWPASLTDPLSCTVMTSARVTGYRYTCDHAWLLTWLLGSKLREVPRLMRQVALTTKPSLQPILLLSKLTYKEMLTTA